MINENPHFTNNCLECIQEQLNITRFELPSMASCYVHKHNSRHCYIQIRANCDHAVVYV